MKRAFFITGLIAMGIALGIAGCKKTENNRYGTLKLKVKHTVDGSALVWDSNIYNNEAGNNYSVERIQYYLSDFHFYSNGRLVFTRDSTFFVDARVPAKTEFMFPDCPVGYIDSMSFLIGVKPENNLSNNLPATSDNIAMGWPDMMGGGYHFLKLEGHLTDGEKVSGFAMHIGTNGFQVHAYKAFSAFVRADEAGEVVMTMNINEWFRGPHTYNIANGVYSMGNAPLMQMLKENGADVFSQY